MHTSLGEQYQLNETPKAYGLKPKANIEDIAQRAFDKLYQNGTYKVEDLFKVEEYRQLAKATSEVFNSAIAHEISAEMTAYLQQDSFVFSGLKTHTQLAEARSYLLNEQGHIRPYQDFEEKVTKLNKRYNKNYLEAEYEYAVQSAQSVEAWEGFSNNTKQYALQYRTAADDKVRISHSRLEGVTLPKDDPFWNEYYPPLGWRCRCLAVEVKQSRYPLSNSNKAAEIGKETSTQIGKNGKNKLEMFRYNPAKARKLFPPKNSYMPRNCKGAKLNLTGLIGIAQIVLNEESERCRAKKNMEREANEKLISKLYDVKTVIEYDNGGKVIKCSLVDKEASDYKRVMKAAKELAKMGHTVEITPNLRTTNHILYDVIYKDLDKAKFYGKHPDLKVDGIFYEHEGFKEGAKRALSNMLSRGAKQSEHLIIDDCGDDDRHYRRRAESYNRDSEREIKELWVLRGNGQLDLVYKKTEG